VAVVGSLGRRTGGARGGAAMVLGSASVVMAVAFAVTAVRISMIDRRRVPCGPEVIARSVAGALTDPLRLQNPQWEEEERQQGAEPARGTAA
jgi:hypothetical protein